MNEERQVGKVIRAVPPAGMVDPRRRHPVVLHVTADPRSLGLAVLTAIAALAVLKWASAFFIPVMVGFILCGALSPIVEAMARLRIPRAIGAGVLILGILASSGVALWSLSDDANAIVNALPSAAQRLREVVNEKARRSSGALASLQRAADELAKAAEEVAQGGRNAPTTSVGAQHVSVEKQQFDLRDHLWSGTLGLASVIGQVTVVTFLTYFLLVSGDGFRRKLVKITGPGLAQKKLTVQALDEINSQIQRYLLVQLLTSLGVGLVSWAAFAYLGLAHAAAWGVAAGILNLVPYLGSMFIAVGTGAAAFMQTGEAQLPLMMIGASLLIHTITGNMVVPWLTSAASRMNAVSIFVSVLFWTWLWGVWGLLLGIPVTMIIKAVCDRVDDLKPLGELLES